MTFAGQSDPCAYVEIKSIGALAPAAMTRAFCDLIEDATGIPKARIYIGFDDVDASCWAGMAGRSAENRSDHAVGFAAALDFSSCRMMKSRYCVANSEKPCSTKPATTSTASASVSGINITPRLRPRIIS